MAKEIFVSVDVEADGPIPGRNSMLSFGALAFTVDEKTAELTELGRFERNLLQLPEASPDPVTMVEFWSKNPEAWEISRKDARPAVKVMREYRDWLKSFSRKPVFVGYPGVYDFMFIHWYLIAFADEDPCGFSALDMKTYACATLKKPFRDTVRSKMPKEWFAKENEHKHVAIADAVEQAHMFAHMLAENYR